MDLALKPYMLDVPDAITVEFFLNAREADIFRGSWLAFLCARHDTKNVNGDFLYNRLPFLFQENGDGRMYFRADAPGNVTCTRHGSTQMFDGKWHHVAMTIESLANGQHRMTGFVDYEEVGNLAQDGWFTMEDYHFLRIGQIDKSNSTFLIDEVRISKGALGVADFLRLAAPKGTFVVVR